MGIDELGRWLTAAGVDAGSVRLGIAPDPDAASWCVRAATGPDGTPGWEVFWAEDGARYAWTWFDDEATACFALFGRLAWTRLVRGALGPTR